MTTEYKHDQYVYCISLFGLDVYEPGVWAQRLGGRTLWKNCVAHLHLNVQMFQKAVPLHLSITRTLTVDTKLLLQISWSNNSMTYFQLQKAFNIISHFSYPAELRIHLPGDNVQYFLYFSKSKLWKSDQDPSVKGIWWATYCTIFVKKKYTV